MKSSKLFKTIPIIGYFFLLHKLQIYEFVFKKSPVIQRKFLTNGKIVRNLNNNFRNDFAFDSNGTWPYVSGANLVFIADFVYDFRVKNAKQVDQIRNGDIIYVKIDLIGSFFQWVLPKIDKKIILITHNGDNEPKLKHIKHLNNENLIVWFGQNPTFYHPKFIALPIGLENPYWNPSKTIFIRNLNLNTDIIPWKNRKYSIYLNFSPHTNQAAREYLLTFYSQFKDALIIKERVSYATYMNQIGNSKYVLCPRGNGLDTHRYYETILMGAIPIVENSTLYSIFKESTTLVLNSFKDLNQTMLDYPERFIPRTDFSRDVVMMDYWLKKISDFEMIYADFK
jgi:hypothetical protein